MPVVIAVTPASIDIKARLASMLSAPRVGRRAKLINPMLARMNRAAKAVNDSKVLCVGLMPKMAWLSVPSSFRIALLRSIRAFRASSDSKGMNSPGLTFPLNTLVLVALYISVWPMTMNHSKALWNALNAGPNKGSLVGYDARPVWVNIYSVGTIIPPRSPPSSMNWIFFST